MDAETRTYEVVFDEATTERFDKAAARYFWKEWLIAVFGELTRFLIISFAALLIYDTLRSVEPSVRELLGAALIASVAGAGWYLMHSLEALPRARKADLGEVWHCTISDAAWSYQRRDGTLISHPWTTMKLKFEHDDGYLVDTSSGPVLVYRGPLREAGLEDEFLERLKARA